MKSSIVYLSTEKCTFCYVYYYKIKRENQILMAFICMWIKQLLSLLNNQVAIKSMCLVEQELPTLTQHLHSPPVFSWIFNCMCMLYISLFVPFVLFLFAIVLSVLIRYSDSDYLFGIFKLFLHWYEKGCNFCN